MNDTIKTKFMSDTQQYLLIKDKPLSKWFKREPWEMGASIVIASGIVMLLQPFWMILYTWSFVVTLIGVALFVVVSKFPD